MKVQDGAGPRAAASHVLDRGGELTRSKMRADLLSWGLPLRNEPEVGKSAGRLSEGSPLLCKK